VTWHTDEDGARDTAAEVAGLGRGAVVRPLEVTRFEEAAGTLEQLAAELGGLDVRLMVDAGTRGRIVNITSVHEHIPLREAAAYGAAKGGLGLLTKSMALELGEHGSTVNSIAPGEIATPRTRSRPTTSGRPCPPADPATRTRSRSWSRSSSAPTRATRPAARSSSTAA
jgi:NAD(P)-dependent dehydrogenase (short-subunit alcohol dehydrogenase family)